MSNELTARAIELIKAAEEIHKASDNYYITVSIGRIEAHVHVSYFGGKSMSFVHFSTSTNDTGNLDIIFDEDLTQAVAFIENIRKKVGV